MQTPIVNRSKDLVEVKYMETELSLRNITKRYPGVIALDDVSLEFNKGEIHAM